MLEMSLAASSLLLEIARLVMRFGCFLFLGYLLLNDINVNIIKDV